MKNFFVVAIFCTWFLSGFVLAEFRTSLPGFVAYVPDAILYILFCFILMRLLITGGWSKIPVKYWLLFFGLLYVVIAGIVLNDVTGDTVFAGLRSFIRCIPLFILPFAFYYTDKDLKFHFVVLFALMLVQIPASVWQRFIAYADLITGDLVGGTLGSSATLAIAGCMMVLLVVAAYVDGKLSLRKAVFLGLVGLIPTSLAETKITPIFLVIGIAAVIFVRRKTLSPQRIAAVSLISVTLLGLFVGVYDILYSENDRGYFELMSDKERMVDSYNYKGVRSDPIDLKKLKSTGNILGQVRTLDKDVEEMGRIDAIIMPFDGLAHEPIHLALGLGIGNVTTNFGSGAAYWEVQILMDASAHTFSHLTWETGLFGMLLYSIFLLVLTWDIYRSAMAPDGPRTLAAGMFGVMSIVWICMLYGNHLFLPQVMVAVAFLSGFIVSRRARVGERTTPRIFDDHERKTPEAAYILPSLQSK